MDRAIAPKDACYCESTALAPLRTGQILHGQGQPAQTLAAYTRAGELLRRATELVSSNTQYIIDLYILFHDRNWR